LIVMWYLRKLVHFRWGFLGNMIMILQTMVGVINTLLCIREKNYFGSIDPSEIVQSDKERATSLNNVKSKNQ
jgi:hypothetical protein